MVNGPNLVYAERKGKLQKTDVKFRDNDHVREVIEQIIKPLGRQIHGKSPMVDSVVTRVLDGCSAPQYQPSAYGGPLGLSQAAATAPAQVRASAPYAPVAYQPYAPPLGYGRSYKSRTTYIVLGIFLGALGIHNFYAGYVGRAVGQLCLTVLTLGYLGIISWIWAIVEICIVEKDSTGLNFS